MLLPPNIANYNSVLDLPKELLASLVLKQQHPQHDPDSTDREQISIGSSASSGTTAQESDSHLPAKGSASCTLCSATFLNFNVQRDHTRTDWHGYNLKQRLNGLKTVTEIEFEKLIDELDMSISGSEDDSSDEDAEKVKEGSLPALLRKQANLHEGEEAHRQFQKHMPKGSPMTWFSSSLLPQDMSFGIYKALFTEQELKSGDLVDTIRKKQLQAFRPVRTGNIQSGPPSTSPSIFLCMIGGGHFAGMIISLTPKLIMGATGMEERQAIVLAHKTFHRYTTRRKQGGSQSANDASKGNAHSAGAGIRRYNETALEAEIRALLVEWKSMIDGSDLLFVRASGVTNRRTLFASGPDQVLKSTDPRIRGFPFNTRRATQGELMRAFVELTRAKVTKLVEVEPVEEKKKETPKKKESPQVILSKEEQEALLHTSQIQALIRRSKASTLISYISNNSLSPSFIFHPPDAHGNRHAPTPLHLASSTNSSAVVHSLLVKAKADPTHLNPDGKSPFELAGDRSTRDAFRIARSELGEAAWDWSRAHCPPPITKAEAEERDRLEKFEEQDAEQARREAELERLEKERSSQPDTTTPSNPGKQLGSVPMTAEDRREIDSRGLSPEMRTKLERERRARAAEERMKKMSSGNG